MTKRFLAALTALSLTAVCLSACGDASDSGDSAQGSKTVSSANEDDVSSEEEEADPSEEAEEAAGQAELTEYGTGDYSFAVDETKWKLYIPDTVSYNDYEFYYIGSGEEEYGYDSTTLIFFSQEDTGFDGSLADYVDSLVEIYSDNEYFTVLDAVPGKQGEYDCYDMRLTASYDGEHEDKSYIMRFFYKDGMFFEISYSATASNYDGLRYEFEAAAETFEILK